MPKLRERDVHVSETASQQAMQAAFLSMVGERHL